MILDQKKFLKWLKIFSNIINRNLTFLGCLSAFSFSVIVMLLFINIFGNYTDNENFKRIFNFSNNNDSFIWLLGIFVITANIGYVRDIITSAVRERMDSVTIRDIRESLKEDFSSDPEIYRRLQIAYERKIINKSTPLDENKLGNISIDNK